MANIKAVDIQGFLPYNVGDDPDMLRELGRLNTPSWGLRIHWSAGPVGHRPNSHGGRTAYYSFILNGQEAVSYDALRSLVRSILKVGGELKHARVRDVENGGDYTNLLS